MAVETRMPTGEGPTETQESRPVTPAEADARILRSHLQSQYTNLREHPERRLPQTTPMGEVVNQAELDEIKRLEALFQEMAARETGGTPRPGNATPENAQRQAEARRRRLESGQGISLSVEFGELAEDPDALRERVEELIRSREIGIREFESGFANQLATALNQGVRNNIPLQTELINRVSARYKYQNGIRAAVMNVDDFAGIIGNFEQTEHQEILRTAGVKKALKILERNNGEYYRRAEMEARPINNEDHIEADMDKSDIWVLNKKLQLMDEMAVDNEIAVGKDNPRVIDPTQFDRLRVKEAFKELDKGIKSEGGRDEDQQFPTVDEVVAKLMPADQFSEDQRNNFFQVLYQTQRAFRLAEKTHNVLGLAAKFDGPRWAEGSGHEANSLVTEKDLGHVVLEYKGTHIDLTKDSFTEDEIKVLNDVRGGPSYLIPLAWSEAWREFYHKNYGKLDKQKSLSGRGPAAYRRLWAYPVMMEKESYAHPGTAEDLRRYTFSNVGTVMMRTGRTNAEDQINNWAGDISLIGDHAARIKGGEEFRKNFTEGGIELLDKPEAITDAVKTLETFKHELGYLSEKEREEELAFLARGIIETQIHHMKRDFKFENIPPEAAENTFYHLYSKHVLGKDEAKKAEGDILGRRFLGGYLWSPRRFYTEITFRLRRLKTAEPYLNAVGSIFGILKAMITGKLPK